MDGTDRKIVKSWSIITTRPKPTPHAPKVTVAENVDRLTVQLTVNGPWTDTPVHLSLSVEDIVALARILDEARERLETLGAVNELEKIVP